MPDFKPTLVTLTHPRSPAAEAYRTLRANLYLFSADHPLHTLVVTSVAPGEDKSTTLANLAVTMAQGQQRVILVDADLRRPSLHELFGVPNEHGLTTLLDEQDALTTLSLAPVANVEHLQLLPSGPWQFDPAALLGSPQMDKVIAVLRQRADVVLFDAPPVLATTDAAVLGVKTDGVLLVVQARHTSRDHVQRAKERLEKVHVRIVGVTLTHVAADRSLGGYDSTTIP